MGRTIIGWAANLSDRPHNHLMGRKSIGWAAQSFDSHAYLKWKKKGDLIRAPDIAVAVPLWWVWGLGFEGPAAVQSQQNPTPKPSATAAKPTNLPPTHQPTNPPPSHQLSGSAGRRCESAWRQRGGGRSAPMGSDPIRSDTTRSRVRFDPSDSIRSYRSVLTRSDQIRCNRIRSDRIRPERI